MRYVIELYENDNGKAPILDYILDLTPKQQAKVYRIVNLLEKYGHELRFPFVEKIKGRNYDGLWELRIQFGSDIFRIFYFVYTKNVAVFLHGFTKKQQKTPKKELDLAYNRMNDFLRRKNNEMGNS